MTVHASWQKSSFSGMGPDNDCLEVAARDGGLLLREGEAPGDVLTTNARRFAGLLRATRNGTAEIWADRQETV
ncbi:DUF397 domain-containing protein [Streptomyces mayteni]